MTELNDFIIEQLKDTEFHQVFVKRQELTELCYIKYSTVKECRELIL